MHPNNRPRRRRQKASEELRENGFATSSRPLVSRKRPLFLFLVSDFEYLSSVNETNIKYNVTTQHIDKIEIIKFPPLF